MTNELQKIFNYAGQQVRTVMRNDEPWFVASDVASVLEVKNIRQVLGKLDEDEKLMYTMYTVGQNRATILINESGLYSIVLTSRKPEAKAFKRWITHEVIPSIRKHGAYMTENTLESAINDPDFMIELLTSLKEEKAKRIEAEQANTVLTLELEEAKPKAEKYQAFLNADGLTTFTVVGKNFLDGMSAIEVRKFLQEEGVLFKRKVDGVYVPKHGYEKYFRIIPYVGYGYGNARKVVTRTLKVTNEGIDFIVDLSKQKVNSILLNRFSQHEAAV